MKSISLVLYGFFPFPVLRVFYWEEEEEEEEEESQLWISTFRGMAEKSPWEKSPSIETTLRKGRKKHKPNVTSCL